MANVIKATGEIEPFNEEKLRSSIRRAGIPKELEDQVTSHITSKLHDNMPTFEIYRHIREFLDSSSSPYAGSKYSLKQAIMTLGPTGYPFEDFFADILKNQGYSTQTRIITAGKCISHEIDIIAEKAGKKIMVEAKYHNVPGIKTDVHAALYTKARFDDVKEKNGFTEVWLVTNTKVSLDAINYSFCSGVKIISWNYPEKESLRDMIENVNLAPVTMLSTLSGSQKQKLLLNHIVLCKDIYSNQNSVAELGLSEAQKNNLMQEAKFLSNTPREN